MSYAVLRPRTVDRSRFPIRSRSEEDEDEEYGWGRQEQRATIEVDDLEPVFTGLYDEHGDPIYRVPEPVGF